MAEADVAFNALRQLIDELGISLDLPHLDEALTHPSYANELGAGQRDNQRLEFLGDAVLGVCVSELLMEAFEEVDEGQLTLMRASLVNTLALAQRAKQLGLAETLMVGRGADAAGERYRTNVLADALEALVGAVYLDAGLHGARLLTREVVGEQLATLVHDGGMVRDAKSRLQERLQAVGSAPPTYEVVSAEDGVGALVELEQGGVDLVLSDLHMPEMDGGELLAHIVQRWPALPVIMVTAASDVSEVVTYVQRGATNYIVKPAAPAAVTSAIEQALASREVEPGGDGTLADIVGTSKAMVEVRHRVTLAARSDVPVLITGATGTGKELVARAIYSLSRSSQGEFVPHNCAVSPRDLFESQFFGHRKGAFTGADRDHLGLLREADSGMLFLDELETLDPMFQAKLLRVLDDGEVRPVGSEKNYRVSVRFVAATNREPQAMLEDGSLREDLYYRLRGFEVQLPRLAERKQDIPALIAHFLGTAPAPTPEALAILEAAPWPGNVRELRNVILSAASVANGRPIEPGQLPSSLESIVDEPTEPEAYGQAGADGASLALRDVERRAILEAMDRCGGNRSKAARLLEIDRSTLRRKLHEFESAAKR